MRFLTQKSLSINIMRLFRKFLYAPSLNYLAVVSVFVRVTVFGDSMFSFSGQKIYSEKGFPLFHNRYVIKWSFQSFPYSVQKSQTNIHFCSQFLLVIRPDPTCENIRNYKLIPQACQLFNMWMLFVCGLVQCKRFIYIKFLAFVNLCGIGFPLPCYLSDSMTNC